MQKIPDCISDKASRDPAIGQVEGMYQRYQALPHRIRQQQRVEIIVVFHVCENLPERQVHGDKAYAMFFNFRPGFDEAQALVYG